MFENDFLPQIVESYWQLAIKVYDYRQLRASKQTGDHEMTYQTALEIAKHLGVISETGFAELVAKHSDKLSLECPNEFIDTIENSPTVKEH